MLTKFTAEKLFDGYSTCFRQWIAKETHCKFLHGYGISFRVTFEGELDEKNWVFDFGGMKRAKTLIDYDGKKFNPKDLFAYLFDHTTIIAEDDPHLDVFKDLDRMGVIQLRVMKYVGCERFAQFLYKIINDFLFYETKGRVRAVSVTVYEHERNSATFKDLI
jgi:6-pyruvoyltetrahydropterin/6-carboxytetrahydropterin synthase